MTLTTATSITQTTQKSSPSAPGTCPDVRETIRNAIAKSASKLVDVSLFLHSNPEIAYEEFKAHALLTDFLEAEGFAVERHYKGFETAWKATFSNGPGPVFGLNSEYDALPKIGHACGHNLICILGIGALFAMREAMIKHDIKGTVVLLGTPAEEGKDGKGNLLERGAYDGIEACMMAHPAGGDNNGIDGVIAPNLAVRRLNIEFHGKSAHAALAPWQGINALDAAVQAYTAINAMRQHIQSHERIHGVILNGGESPNVIPKLTSMWYYCRSGDPIQVDALAARVVAACRAAALATGCEVNITMPAVCADLNHSPSLSSEFAAVMKEEFGHNYIVNLDKTKPRTASTDFGTITYVMPGCHPHYNITNAGFKVHTADFARMTGTPEAHDITLNVAAGVASTGIRFLTDEVFAAEAKAQWEVDMSEFGAVDRRPGARWGANPDHLLG